VKIILVFILICQLINCASSEGTVLIELEGKAIAISDGDTFTLLTNENVQIKVRLHGIDCPEKKQDFGQVAKKKLSELIFGKQVKVIKKSVDRYGRTVGIVYDTHNSCINEEMLKAGLAWHYTKYDENPEWQEMQNLAKIERVGLWSHSSPTPPWEWRKKRKS
jgi:micrococcal nuclease